MTSGVSCKPVLSEASMKKIFHKQLKVSLLCLCAALLGLCSCSSSSGKGRLPQEIRLNLKHEPPTLDPRKGGDVISSHMHFLLFEGLVRLKADYSIEMAQARAFERSLDGKTYTFFIREEAVWSDGSKVTAYDFEKAWKNILAPTFPSVNAHLLYSIKNAEAAKKGQVPLSEVGICAPDEKTFVITLEKPVPYFLELISFCVFFPVNSAIDVAAPDWARDAGAHFVSNGPFVLKEWKHDNEIVAERNPLYWDAAQTRPERIHFSMVGNEMTALELFEKGELDMIGDPISALPVDALAAIQRKWPLKRCPVGGTTIIAFNIEKFPFNNKHIRKALSYAINRAEIVQNVTQTGELPALCPVPPVLKGGRNPSFFADANAELAREHLRWGLEELGCGKEVFESVTYLYSTEDKSHKVAQAIQQQWKEVLGIHVPIQNCDFKVLMSRLSKRDFALGQSLWVAQYNDPMNILERFRSKQNVKNYPGWEHAQYAELLERSFYEEGRERLDTLEQAESIFAEEMPICPIYHWDMTYLVQPHLCNVELSPIGDVVFNSLSISKTKK